MRQPMDTNYTNQHELKRTDTELENLRNYFNHGWTRTNTDGGGELTEARGGNEEGTGKTNHHGTK